MRFKWQLHETRNLVRYQKHKNSIRRNCLRNATPKQCRSLHGQSFYANLIAKSPLVSSAKLQKKIVRQLILNTAELRQNHACFGRDYPSDENMDSFVFDEVNFIPKYVERISKCHFTIERVPLAESGAPNFNPAILTCHGRNGMFVNDQKLTIGDKKILANNDQLKLTRSIRWFDFTYQQIPIDIHTFPKQCRETYHVGNQIGSGGCGVVRLVHNYKTNERFAMKVILKDTNPMVRQRNHNNAKILNEVNIMKSLKNPHVLGLIDFYETPERVIIIMEYMEGRDMLHRITKGTSNGRYLSESDSKFFFYQACLGMKYLHDSYVSHRDIKPDNILLSDDGPDAVLKISDFGLSKFISVDSMKTVCGTQLYVAPEILIQGGTYTNKVDIWSMGCLLFAMLSGTVPFSETYGPPDISTQIKEARYSFRNRAWDGVRYD